MTKNNSHIIIFGAGGHAKSVISIIEAESKWQIHGLYVDCGSKRKNDSILGYEIIDNETQLQKANITRAFVAIGDNHVRAKITNKIMREGISLIHTVHPLAIVMTDFAIGSGTMIHAQAILGADCRVGSNVIISAMVCVAHDSYIGEYAHLAPGVLIGGGATIGDYSFLGMGATVLPNVTIGTNVQVGANSVVLKDLEDNVVVVGNPARVIKRNIHS